MLRRALRPTLAILVMLGLTLVMAGCGSTKSTGSAAGATYVAIGDSYTAFPGTSSQINTACLRSSENYPHLLATALHYSLADMSCSGAKTADLVTSQKAGVEPQLDALSAGTRLVTVSIGANDYALSALLLDICVADRNLPAAGHNPCEVHTFADATKALVLLKATLPATYAEIKSKAPNARVIVVGYPQILGNSGACAKFPLAAGDLTYLNALNTQLNAVVEDAAKEAGFTYLDIATASMSHGICSSDPWINGMTAVAGKALAVHPFANEQQAVAAMLERTLKAS